jgi:hypothetical protein
VLRNKLGWGLPHVAKPGNGLESPEMAGQGGAGQGR